MGEVLTGWSEVLLFPFRFSFFSCFSYSYVAFSGSSKRRSRSEVQPTSRLEIRSSMMREFDFLNRCNRRREHDTDIHDWGFRGTRDRARTSMGLWGSGR